MSQFTSQKRGGHVLTLQTSNGKATLTLDDGDFEVGSYDYDESVASGDLVREFRRNSNTFARTLRNQGHVEEAQDLLDDIERQLESPSD